MDKASQRTFALRDFWATKQKADALPRWRDFDPQSLKAWIGNLALVEITDGGALFRICGTNLHGRFGGEFTGRKLSSLSPDIAPVFHEGVRNACQTKVPYDLIHECVVDGETQSFHDIHLPLSDDNTQVNAILFASFQVQK